MIIWGINETAHDAALSVLCDGDVLFASHAERFSKRKNDWYLNDEIIDYALNFGQPDRIAYYEKPWVKKSRILLRGGLGGGRPYFKKTGLAQLPSKNFPHHYSHAAAGYYTSKFDDAVVVVLDAIGEYTCSSIWRGRGKEIRNIYKKNYPTSFGLFYSAFTDLLGLKPNQEEYIMMGMAAFGDGSRYFDRVNSYFPNSNTQKYNFHKGIYDWPEQMNEQSRFDIAAAAQKVYEMRLREFMTFARELSGANRLVFMGGCALNSSANTALWDIFEDVWIMPNPGDAGSSLGAAAAMYGRHINWVGPYLGYDMGGEYPVKKALAALKKDRIVAVASGRAEFGPRALGNRSILADPRGEDIQELVNKIKQREPFRPFAPVVLKEHVLDWFDAPSSDMPYMQYTVRCKRPTEIPAVVHKDGTSRVQTVSHSDHPMLYRLLREWHDHSGVPILLNTSLNVKNQPLLNDHKDAYSWESFYNGKILTGEDNGI